MYERFGPVNRVNDPTSPGSPGFFTELLTEHSVFWENLLQTKAYYLLRLPVRGGNRRRVGLQLHRYPSLEMA